MKKAFTLAEVLLVLAIIGVIAALTVPNLVTSNMDKKYVALAKKAQTTLQQAIDTKMGDAAVGTNTMDGSSGVLRWLATSQAGGNIPAVLRVSNSSGNSRYLTTDGILYQDVTFATSCTNTAPCRIRIDLDGSAGITASSVTSDIATSTTTTKLNRDVIELEVRRNFVAPSKSGNSAALRANEYLGFSVNN